MEFGTLNTQRFTVVDTPASSSRAGVLQVKRAVEVLFAVFLLLVFVGLEPFKIRDLEAISQISTGEGDLLRQIIYVATFSIIFCIALLSRGLVIMRSIPGSVAFVVIWCALSAIWSVAPEITLRRAGLSAIVVATVFIAVDILGPPRVLRLLYAILAGVLVINLLSLAIVPQSMHLSGEAGPALIGNWRGLYYHKNIAGPVSALSALLFMHLALERRRRRDWFLLVGAIVFTLGSQSKTSIGLLMITIAFSLFYRFAERTATWRRLFVVTFVALVLLVSMLFLEFMSEFAYWLRDPDSLTGRGAVWEVVMASIGDHLILGSGFGAFWQSGAASPALWLAKEGWITTTSHSHNGYLEILLTTGIAGFILVIFSVIITPLRWLLAFDKRSLSLNFLLFSWISFILLLNLTETTLFERDKPEWVVLLIALATIHYYRRKPTSSNLAPVSTEVFRR